MTPLRQTMIQTMCQHGFPPEPSTAIFMSSPRWPVIIGARPIS